MGVVGVGVRVHVRMCVRVCSLRRLVLGISCSHYKLVAFSRSLTFELKSELFCAIFFKSEK